LDFNFTKKNYFFPGCDITHQEDEDSAKSLNSNDNQPSSSMMEETTNENDLQVSFFDEKKNSNVI